VNLTQLYELRRKGKKPAGLVVLTLLPELSKHLEEANRKLTELQSDRRMLKEDVDSDDIANIVSQWTGIPVAKMREGEKLIQDDKKRVFFLF